MTSIKTYSTEITNSNGVSIAQERILCDQIQAGSKEGLDELVSANLLFVVTVAARFVGRGLPMNDLISEGNQGMIRAAEKFDASKEYRFITYSVAYIQAYIRAFIAKQVRPVHLPQNQDATVQKIAKATKCLAQSLGYTPRYEVAVDEVGIDLKLASYLLIADNRGSSLDEPTAHHVTRPMLRIRVYGTALLNELALMIGTLESIDG